MGAITDLGILNIYAKIFIYPPEKKLPNPPLSSHWAQKVWANLLLFLVEMGAMWPSWPSFDFVFAYLVLWKARVLPVELHKHNRSTDKIAK